MDPIDCSMKNKDLNKIAAIEQAIAKKYGDEAIQNPRANWDEDKEKEYLDQMRELYKKNSEHKKWEEKIDVNGIKVSKKLFNRDSLQRCMVCSSSMKKTADDVCFLKYECCYNCYIQYVEGREERWEKGWRPNNENNQK
jgi:predicted transglutaminase-like protease